MALSWQRRFRFQFISALIVCLAGAIWHLSGQPATAKSFTGPDNPEMINSASPYLRSHGNDLVRWREWGKAAFEEAAKTERPLLVSFGYYACHWCHVMQETHFNDAAIAKTINEFFIPVIVDRERRTSLDETYMLVTEALTQRGGWPNTVFMTSDQKPFYGTAYIPPENFTELLAAISDGWRDDRSSLLAEGERVSSLLTTYLTRQEAALDLDAEMLGQVTKYIAGEFDPFTGGVGQGPKFFQQPLLMFLLQQAERNSDAAALAAVETTLKSVQTGGILDHIEGGFHRYTVDPGWRVPHFEKMLYDQAQMAEVFVTAYRITGKPEYAATAQTTLDYILADLTSPMGGFYATRDADSEGEEGTFYVWTPEELNEVLGKTEGEYASASFGVVPDGELAGKVILNLENQAIWDQSRIDAILATLAEARKNRQKPNRDEKIITSWNGMTIAALAQAAAVLGRQDYRDAAKKAGEFVWNKLRTKDKLLRSYFDGRAEVSGELDDYAQLARGYLFLYDLTSEKSWLERALTLTEQLTLIFEDKEVGDFFGAEAGFGLGRTKPRGDGDQPSPNAVALDLLARLSQRTPDPDFKRRAEALVAALSGFALNSPAAGGAIFQAADGFLRGQTGSIQFSGNGAVRVEAFASPSGDKFIVKVNVAEGWHINADKPLEDYLIPTSLKLVESGNEEVKPDPSAVVYPIAAIKSLASNKKPMALLENEFEIVASVANLNAPTAAAQLHVQTCSDEICLEPETLSLKIAWPSKN